MTYYAIFVLILTIYKYNNNNKLIHEVLYFSI